jgi:endonuclease/exonuclease/phosphatase family metal-dependent hydrolase
LIAACASEPGSGPAVVLQETPRVRTVADTYCSPVSPDLDAGIPVEGETRVQPSEPLTALTWNLRWFGDPERSPVDDEEAFRFAQEVVASENADIVALQEICDGEAFERLLLELPQYAGALSSYRWQQRIAVLWNEQRWALLSARGLHGLDDAGRPPLTVGLRNREDRLHLRIIAVHAKAGDEPESRDTRESFALGLLEHLREHRAGERLLLLGDLNDRLTASIAKGEPSPYRSWTADRDLVALTAGLDRDNAAEPSSLWGDVVDHVFASPALVPAGQPVRAEVLRDELLAVKSDYLETVSDHFPVRVTISPWSRPLPLGFRRQLQPAHRGMRTPPTVLSRRISIRRRQRSLPGPICGCVGV